MSEIPRDIVDKAEALHQATRTEISAARKRNQLVQPRLPEPKVHRLPGRLETDTASPKRTDLQRSTLGAIDEEPDTCQAA